MHFLHVILLAFCVLAANCSPIHGIWNNLPANPVKRVYGFYNYLPKEEDDRDKRNSVVYWAVPEDYVN